MESEENILAYAAGTVLFGYLLALPFWGVGALWNAQKRWQRVNPWSLPLAAFFFVYLCFGVSHSTQPRPNDWIVALGILPAALGCAGQAVSYGRK